MRVLAVELDDLTIERFKASFRGTELTLHQVSWATAIEEAVPLDGPLIVVLEWVGNDEAELVRFCETLRAAMHPHRCHIVALGSSSEHDTLLRSLSGTVDDVLNRPFGADLGFRFRHAATAIQKQGDLPASARAALEEALTSETGGEVAVRSGEVTAFIHVQDGHVVWANVSSAPSTMEEVLSHVDVRIERDIISAVKEEARSTRKHFMEVLVRWDLIDGETAREAVRAFVAGRVEMALALPNATGLFLPRARPHTERLRFHTSEIPSLKSTPIDAPPSGSFDLAPVSQSRHQLLPMGEILTIVNDAAAIDGALGAIVLDRKTGASIAQAGSQMDASVAWSQLAALTALGPSAEDVIAITGEKCFVTRSLGLAPSLVLFVALSLASTTPGLARSTIARLSSRRSALGDAPSNAQEDQE